MPQGAQGARHISSTTVRVFRPERYAPASDVGEANTGQGDWIQSVDFGNIQSDSGNAAAIWMGIF